MTTKGSMIRKLEAKLKHYHDLAGQTQEETLKKHYEELANAFGEAIKIVEGRA